VTGFSSSLEASLHLKCDFVKAALTPRLASTTPYLVTWHVATGKKPSLLHVGPHMVDKRRRLM